MLRLGEKQKLAIVKQVDFGVYLAQDTAHADERVLLPAKQVPDGAKTGDVLEVFLYKDSKDRPIATVNEPKLTIGQVARLTVLDTAGVGAFLDWGLEKDLLLPFREQTRKVRTGDEVLVTLYIDKSSRLCATMKVYDYLSKESPYKKDDQVTGMIYEISERFGAFVAVDDRYSALIPPKEMYGKLEVGMQVSARIVQVKEDGKLDLSLRQKAYMQMGEDAKKVEEAIRACGGKLPFTDKASPELIRERMGMSKAEFKRAVGSLLKKKKIRIEEDGIRLV
ncbi:MAG: RNA-binding protein [Lachnospiraceae bacterium]|nr:RNA-binding protein [Lachnospiraceae bacterium]